MSLVNELARGMDGLSQMRALRAMQTKPGILKSLDFDFVELEKGHAVFGGFAGEHAYNPIGSVHGGYAATLLDSACGCVIHSMLSAEQIYTTLELKVAYHRPITKDSGYVRAVARVTHLGRRVGYAVADLVGEDGVLYASATSTLLIINLAANQP